MKIAFCISGHLRHYKTISESYLAFKQYLEHFGSIDTFVCTWDKINTNQSWSHAHNLSEHNSHLIETNLSEVQDFYQTKEISILNEEFYSSEYSTLNYKNFTYNEYNWDDRGIYNQIPHCIKTMYLIYKCNELKKYKEFSTKQKYDLVFRLRPDAVYSEEFSKYDFSTIKSNILYVTSFPGKIYADFGRFALGDSATMDKYSNAFLRVNQVFDKNIFGDPEKVYHYSLLNLIDLNNILYIPNLVLLSSEKYIKFLR